MRVAYISILGEPGSYDVSVYDDIPGRDDETQWFRRGFGHVEGIEILGFRIPQGDPIPSPDQADAFILGGSFHSVHDDFAWQRQIIEWFDALRSARRPLLGLCGGHQLMCHSMGVNVVGVCNAPVVGTRVVSLTEAGRRSPLFDGIESPAYFHYACVENVEAAPEGGVVLAESDDIPVDAIDYGENWYSTQFHPEGMVDTMSTSVSLHFPELAGTFRESKAGRRLIENFINLSQG